ncbi:MAG: glutamine-hydrolyzing carbamoyl-phosphate synthase small subunit, partial [Panacagrimonas sp.]
ADGSLFHGYSIGATGRVSGEVVFNTAMTGYQEILTDTSYRQQIVTLTYPHIGNVGSNVLDTESDRVQLAGLVLREVPRAASNFRSTQNFSDYLRAEKVVAIGGIDTRRLTRILRDKGAQNGCIAAGGRISEKVAIAKAREFPGLAGMNLAGEVSTSSAYGWNQGSWELKTNAQSTPQTDRFHVVVYDFGVKRNILRMLVDRGCRLTVVPADTSAREVLKRKPDGIMLSNGPGDPEPCGDAIQAVRKLLDSGKPMFGICLGHQILSLAAGAQTLKMKFGHHGANHPVQDLETGRVLITSQNHGFSVDESSLPAQVEVTHRSLFDGSNQGIRLKNAPAFGFQGHPEASPGPHDLDYLFDRFVDSMEKARA